MFTAEDFSMKKEPTMSENHVDDISDSEGELSKIDFSGNTDFHTSISVGKLRWIEFYCIIIYDFFHPPIRCNDEK